MKILICFLGSNARHLVNRLVVVACIQAFSANLVLFIVFTFLLLLLSANLYYVTCDWTSLTSMRSCGLTCLASPACCIISLFFLFFFIILWTRLCFVAFCKSLSSVWSCFWLLLLLPGVLFTLDHAVEASSATVCCSNFPRTLDTEL